MSFFDRERHEMETHPSASSIIISYGMTFIPIVPSLEYLQRTTYP